MMEPLIFL
jgi:hypothetical protein